jgi:hypothetical protein
MSPKADLPIDAPGYAPVADRIALFYARHPTGRILTDLVSRDEGVVTFRARVYRTAEDPRPAATGWAAEREGDGEVNAVACLENTETSAIGRALANLGFLASTRRPSAEEMGKAARGRARLARAGNASGLAGAPPARSGRDGAVTTREADAPSPAVSDLLDLLAVAGAWGLDAPRVTRLRERLLGGRYSLGQVERLERALRGWLDGRRQGR